MSLVNQMLQDLERRQAGGVVVGNGEVLAELSASAMPPARAGGFRALHGLMLALGAIALASVIWRNVPLDGAVSMWQSLVPEAASPAEVAMPVKSLPVARSAVSAPAKVEFPAETVQLSPSVPARQHRLRLAHRLTRTSKSVPSPVVASEPAVISAPPAAEPVVVSILATQSEARSQKRTKLPAEKRVSRPPLPRQQPSIQAPALVKTPIPLSPPEQAEREFSRARELLRIGSGARGESGLRRALAFDVGHVDAREILVARLVHRGDLAGAEKLLDAGLQAVPGEPRFTAMWARLLVERGDLVRALGILKLASPPTAGNEQYHALRAAVLQRAGHHREAVEVYRALLLSRPSSGTWWMGLGLSLEALGEREQAHYAYTKAQGSGSLKGKVLQFVEQKLSATP